MTDRGLLLATNVRGIRLLQLHRIAEAEGMDICFPDPAYVSSWQSLHPEQRKLRRKYRQLQLSQEIVNMEWESGEPLNDVIAVLALIDENPDIAQYIEQICWSPRSDSDASREDTRRLQTLRTPLSASFSRIRFDQRYDEREWRTALAEGDHGAIFAVLLTILPNLRYLRLEWCDYEQSNWLNPVFGLARNPASKILTRLDHISIHGRDDDYDYDSCPNVLVCLIELPSLRRLDTYWSGSWDNDAPQQLCRDTTSHIREMELAECTIGPAGLLKWLTPCRDLQRLDMHYFNNSWIYQGVDFLEALRLQIDEICGPLFAERKWKWRAGKFPETGFEPCLGINTPFFGGQEGIMIRCEELEGELEVLDEMIRGKWERDAEGELIWVPVPSVDVLESAD